VVDGKNDSPQEAQNEVLQKLVSSIRKESKKSGENRRARKEKIVLIARF